MNQFNYVGRAKTYHKTAVTFLWLYIAFAVALVIIPILNYLFHFKFNAQPYVAVVTIPILAVISICCLARDSKQKEYMKVMEELSK